MGRFSKKNMDMVLLQPEYFLWKQAIVYERSRQI